MLRKISTQQLRVGMHVHEVCGSWFAHSFWRSSFKVKDAAMLDKVQVGSKVRFKAEKSDGAIVVTSVELAQ